MIVSSCAMLLFAIVVVSSPAAAGCSSQCLVLVWRDPVRSCQGQPCVVRRAASVADGVLLVQVGALVPHAEQEVVALPPMVRLDLVGCQVLQADAAAPAVVARLGALLLL